MNQDTKQIAELRKFLNTLYASDQAGGYVTLDLDDDELVKLQNYITTTQAAALQAERERMLAVVDELDKKYSKQWKAPLSTQVIRDVLQAITNTEKEGE